MITSSKLFKLNLHTIQVSGHRISSPIGSYKDVDLFSLSTAEEEEEDEKFSVPTVDDDTELDSMADGDCFCCCCCLKVTKGDLFDDGGQLDGFVLCLII